VIPIFLQDSFVLTLSPLGSTSTSIPVAAVAVFGVAESGEFPETSLNERRNGIFEGLVVGLEDGNTGTPQPLKASWTHPPNKDNFGGELEDPVMGETSTAGMPTFVGRELDSEDLSPFTKFKEGEIRGSPEVLENAGLHTPGFLNGDENPLLHRPILGSVLGFFFLKFFELLDPLLEVGLFFPESLKLCLEVSQGGACKRGSPECRSMDDSSCRIYVERVWSSSTSAWSDVPVSCWNTRNPGSSPAPSPSVHVVSPPVYSGSAGTLASPPLPATTPVRWKRKLFLVYRASLDSEGFPED